MKWFRMYVEIVDDPKIKQISDRSYRVFTYLLALAAESDMDGLIPMSEDDITWRLRLSQEDLSTALYELSNLGIVTGEIPIQFINWQKRQYKSDHINERVKRFRNKCETLHETLHNTNDETLHETVQNRTEQNREEILSGKPNNGIPVKEIITYLNEKTGKSFLPTTKDTVRHIKARINEGHSLDDFFSVIDTMTTKWRGDPKMVDYLRPQTLFGTKFESYLNTKQTNSKADPFKD